MIDIEKTADNADMIINGYAYTQNGDEIQVLNLNNQLYLIRQVRLWKPIWKI